MKTEHTIEFDRPVRDDSGRTARVDAVVADIELEIDLAGLARELGVRAGRNRGKRAALCGGLIRARVIAEGVVDSAPARS